MAAFADKPVAHDALVVLCDKLPDDPQQRALRMLACVRKALSASVRRARGSRLAAPRRIQLTDTLSVRSFGQQPPLGVEYISFFGELKVLVEEVHRTRLLLAGEDPSLPENIPIMDAVFAEKQTRGEWMSSMKLLTRELQQTRPLLNEQAKARYCAPGFVMLNCSDSFLVLPLQLNVIIRLKHAL